MQWTFHPKGFMHLTWTIMSSQNVRSTSRAQAVLNMCKSKIQAMSLRYVQHLWVLKNYEEFGITKKTSRKKKKPLIQRSSKIHIKIRAHIADQGTVPAILRAFRLDLKCWDVSICSVTWLGNYTFLVGKNISKYGKTMGNLWKSMKSSLLDE